MVASPQGHRLTWIAPVRRANVAKANSGTQRGGRRSARLGHSKMTPMGPNRVHQHLHGIGTASVDHLDSREVEDHRWLAHDQVDDTVDGGTRGTGECTNERRRAVLRVVSEVDEQ